MYLSRCHDMFDRDRLHHSFFFANAGYRGRMVRALIAITFLLLLSFTQAMAQEPVIFGAPNQGAVTTAQEYNGAINGPTQINGTFFATLYDGIIGRIDAAVNIVVGQMVAYVAPLLKLLTVLFVATAGLAYAFAPNAGAPLIAFFVREGWKPGLIVTILGSTDQIERWVINPLRTFPNGVANALAGVGGTPINGGQPFDALFAAQAMVAISAWDHSSGILNMIGEAVLIAVTLLFGLLFLVGSFLIWVGVHAMLLAVLVVAPLALAAGVMAQSRQFLGGWINTAATQVIGLILIVVTLQIIFVVEQQLIAPVIAAPANAKVSGICVALLQMTGCNAVMAGIAWQAQHIAGGICHGAITMARGFSGAAGAMATTFGSGAAAVRGMARA